MRGFALILVTVATVAGVSVYGYSMGQAEQRSHDQLCLASDAAWWLVAKCIGGDRP